MNQRLIIIIAIVLFLLGIVGVYFSESGEGGAVDEAQHSPPTVTYFIAKRIIAAGEQITKEDYDKKVEEITDQETDRNLPDTVDGYYLKESVDKGTTLTKSLLAKDKPILQQSNKLYRYTIDLNKQYVNNIYGLLPGAKVDVYIRFESPKREHDNKSTIYRGESVVRIVKLFKNKKLLTPVMKGKSVIPEEIQSDSRSGEYTIDIELSRSDLKKIYQIENKFDMIVFPSETDLKDKIGANNKDAKK